jgi:hypothetical protein
MISAPVDAAHRRCVVRHGPVEEVPPEQLGVEELGGILLLTDPRGRRLRALFPGGHDQHRHPVATPTMREQGAAAPELDVVGMRADGKHYVAHPCPPQPMLPL